MNSDISAPRTVVSARTVAVAVGAVLFSGLLMGGDVALRGQEGGAAPMPAGYGPKPTLPAPAADHEVMNFTTVVGWSQGQAPRAPSGFTVARYADGLDHPRWLYVLPNGDVLVAESNTVPKPPKTEEDRKAASLKEASKSVGPSANRVTLLRDGNADGTVDERFVLLEGLNQPFGMALVGSTLFVGNTDALMAFPYQQGEERIDAKSGRKIVDLPAGGYNNHWTRNIIANAAGTKLYVTVGSASNIAEHGVAEERQRANVLESNLDGSGLRVFASGLRNPNGMDWEPSGGALWTVVNERDGLGDDLVPDYLAHVREGAFFGWPFAYFGAHRDARVKESAPADLLARTAQPDYALGSHTASLGLTFYRGTSFPARYRGGAFIGQHGSWNRRTLSGYKVIFVAFDKGRPSGPPEDFLTGFLSTERPGAAHGRPVGVAVDRTGSLLVADDAGNTVWRVTRRASRGRRTERRRTARPVTSRSGL